MHPRQAGTKAVEDKNSNARYDFFWFAFNIGDYLRDTQGLSHEEKGVYVDLLCAYANCQKPLPDDDIRLARLAGLSKYKWGKIRKVLEPLFVISNGVWILPRLDAQIARSLEKQAKNKQSGRLGGLSSGERRRAIAEANASTNLKRTLNKPKSDKPPYVSESNGGVGREI